MAREEAILQERYESDISKKAKQEILDEMSKMPPMILLTAYLYSVNFTLLGVDVTKEWKTATEHAKALNAAYRAGYHDALQNLEEKLDAFDKKEETNAKNP